MSDSSSSSQELSKVIVGFSHASAPVSNDFKRSQINGSHRKPPTIASGLDATSKHKKQHNKYKYLFKDSEDDWSVDDEFNALPSFVGGENTRNARSMSSADAISIGSLKVPALVTPRSFSLCSGFTKKRALDILSDPMVSLQDLPTSCDSWPSASPNTTDSEVPQMFKLEKYRRILTAPVVDCKALSKLAWNGIYSHLRPLIWMLLLGYLPANRDRQVRTLAQKRKEYHDSAKVFFSHGIENLDEAIYHQVHIDVPRTNPHIPLYQMAATQRCLERVLYCWSMRHPASGYVQGINDLVTPLFQVFLSAYIEPNVESFDPSLLPVDILDAIEADCFWCLCKLLENLQDNYIHAQPGIHRQVDNLRDLIYRIDNDLANHLEKEGVQFMQFSFRWMNCLLMREMTVKNIIRMWDTYLAEGRTGFTDFHLYVCAAFLIKWSSKLQNMDFQGIIMFLQAPPTQDWSENEIELLLSEAFLWKSLYGETSTIKR